MHEKNTVDGSEILHQFVDRLSRYVRRGVGLFWFSEVLKPSQEISINYINFGMFFFDCWARIPKIVARICLKEIGIFSANKPWI